MWHKAWSRSIKCDRRCLEKSFQRQGGAAAPTKKRKRPKLQIVDNSALSLKSWNARSVKTWEHMPPSHPNWQEVAIKVAERTVSMEITDILSDKDFLMMQKNSTSKSK